MDQTRRNFLRTLCYGTLGSAAMLSGTDRLFRAQALAAPADPADYKALVCVFLFGGNDSNNTVVPRDEYASYAAVRGDLALPQATLLPIKPPSDGRTFGLHPSLTRLHELWQQGKVGIVTNVGTLVEPLTRDAYKTHPELRPVQLFSHPDQQRGWQTAYASGPIGSGWGGRTADLIQIPNATFPTTTSIDRLSIFATGNTTSPLVLPPAPTSLNQTLVLRRKGDTAEGSALRTLLDIASDETLPTLVRAAARINVRAIDNSLALNVDPVINTQFPDTSLANALKQIAKLISFGRSINLSRQIFFCSLGGFDTHGNQGQETGTQATLLKTVSDAIGAFYDATVELGVASQVTTFTMSDFSRTFKPAGSGAGVGSDHAWGSHQFVMGDSVNGGDFYGRFPTLALNGPDDTDEGGNARGRWIPTTSVDQFASTLATWFGVSSSDLALVFPNIGKFDVTDLGFMA
jgi:uncharacterized protein (DUF1501 family)